MLCTHFSRGHKVNFDLERCPVHLKMHTYLDVYIYIYSCTRIYRHTCIYIYIYTQIYLLIHLHMYAYTIHNVYIHVTDSTLHIYIYI